MIVKTIMFFEQNKALDLWQSWKLNALVVLIFYLFECFCLTIFGCISMHIWGNIEHLSQDSSCYHIRVEIVTLLFMCERESSKMAFLSNHDVSSTDLYQLFMELPNQIWVMYYNHVFPICSHKILLPSIQ